MKKHQLYFVTVLENAQFALQYAYLISFFNYQSHEKTSYLLILHIRSNMKW